MGGGAETRGDAEPGSLLDLTVRELLDRVAARTPAPGGGSVAALTAALAAALTAMAARFDEPDETTRDDDARGDGDVVRRADRLAALAAPLADADAAAYGSYLEASRMVAEQSPEARREAMRRALSVASDVPLEVAHIAAEVAALAAGLARSGNPRLRGDAAAGALLASSAASAAAFLVAENLAASSQDRSAQDPRVHRVADLAESARAAAALVTDPLLTAATASRPDQGPRR